MEDLSTFSIKITHGIDTSLQVGPLMADLALHTLRNIEGTECNLFHAYFS
ncbi:hypothetical protein BTN50_1341 [Candidatus Enterovibrio altilux]|uniref:Uncharacterized protein n=1 Tax=Candidatus Enterovibrio altilux TaxID=1927128 RepID=A0A291BA10_9GAMM|nr:hypothetical protein BTN50_1341 [Candidatus Enterovibrio luxaltus]